MLYLVKMFVHENNVIFFPLVGLGSDEVNTLTNIKVEPAFLFNSN